MSHLFALAKELRYAEISELPFPAQGSFARYLWIRAHMILGQYAVVERTLKQWNIEAQNFTDELVLSDDQTFLELLNLQHRAYVRQRVVAAAEDLRDWISRWKVDGRQGSEIYSEVERFFILGEAHACLGYLLGGNSRYKAALREYAAAVSCYERGHMLGQVALARFNLCLCANHLGLEECREREFAVFSAEAATFFKEYSNPLLVAFADRFRAYRELEANRPEEAARSFAAAKPWFLKVNRHRDYAEVLSLEIYLALKTQNISRYYVLHDEYAAFSASTRFSSPMVTCRVNAFREMMEVGIPSASVYSTQIRACQKDDTDGFSQVLLADLMLSSLNHTKKFEDTIRLYRQVSPLPEKYEQMPWLIDYRPYLAEALKQTGHHAGSAAPVLHALKRQDSGFWEIDLNRGEVRFQNQVHTFREYPLVKKFLAVVSEHPQGIEYGQLYLKIYGAEFNPILHQARFHSLISRTRRILPKDALIWQEGIFQFNAQQALHIIPVENAISQKRESRQTVLFNWIRRLKREISAGDLLSDQGGPFFGYSKRTLQYDLERLVKENKIKRLGVGKKTIYQVWERVS